MILTQMSILILTFQQNYYTLQSVMAVIFVSLSFKQHRCLKRNKDFRGLGKIRADCALKTIAVMTNDHINTLIYGPLSIQIYCSISSPSSHPNFPPKVYIFLKIHRSHYFISNTNNMKGGGGKLTLQPREG